MNDDQRMQSRTREEGGEGHKEAGRLLVKDISWFFYIF